MTLNQSPDPNSGKQPDTRRRNLMASAAVVALVALCVTVGTQIPNLVGGADAETTATAVGTPALTTAQGGQPGGFGDLIASVRPAVISVKVTMAAEPVSSDGNDAMPFPFQFGPNGDNPFKGRKAPQRGMVGLGSGFFVSADGTAVTANHVVDHAKSIEITTSDGKTYKAHVVGADQATDVAVIKVDDGGSFPFVKWAEKAPRVGDWVVAIGNPYGLGDTATAGIVSALARDIGSSTYDNFMQIDAPINQGNSGGPTFDVNGNVVGINDAIYTPSGGSVGIGFDIPADTARTVSAALVKDGHVTRGWLGVEVQDVTPELAQGLGVKDAAGALVTTPQADSPAEKAGLKAGDLITAVNGDAIKDGRGLAQEIASLAPGTSVKLDVTHGGKARTVTLTLGEMPRAKEQPPA